MLVLTRNYDFMEYILDHFTLYNIKKFYNECSYFKFLKVNISKNKEETNMEFLCLGIKSD